jgi:gliding motility-associated-like protein
LSPFIRFFAGICLLLAFKTTFSQSLEYVENKGQWDSKVKYESNMGGSVFFLQQHGYRVLLYNKDDLAQIAEAYSGHGHITNNNGGQISSQRVDNATTASTEKNTTPPSKQILLHSHVYEMNFIGSSPNAIIAPDKPLNTYNNYYFGNDPHKWVHGAKVFQAITYQNIYPGVDARFYTGNATIKYDLIIHPGADISKIALEFNGVDGLSVKNGNLIVKTSVGEVSELRPYCYQYDAKGRTDVDAKYIVEGKTVRFKIGNYSKNATLIIDPTLIFASFTGSASDNWGYTATDDGSGNFYAGGIVFGGTPGYPVSPGAYQTNYGGGSNEGQLSGYDIAIIKLSSNGSARLYATYLGGTGNEQPHSLIVDNQGNLIVAGRTTSGDFPSTAPTSGNGGGWDIFISKLSEDGSTLLGSRRIGGSRDDGVNIRSKEIPGALSISRNYGDDARSEVIVDKSDNIYLASCTQSPDFPATANAFQKSFGGGTQDGAIIKTSPDLSNILFASYLGGSGDDAAFTLTLNPLNNNIYLGGATTSKDMKAVSGNSGPILYSTFQGGTCDGFVSLIANSGSALTLTKTCYVGTAGSDMLYGIQFDKFGFPYITGTTTTTFAVVNAPFSQTNGKQYIAKMKPDLSSVIYSTNFGKGSAVPDISITAFLVDRCENVYVAGWGGGLDVSLNYPNATTSGLTVTSDAIKKTTDNNDFYFFVLEKNAASQLYGSFFGNADSQPDVGDHVDGGTSRFDREGVIYEAMCANCGKIGFFPTTPGVWAPNNVSQVPAYCNEAAVKIAFELAGVGSGIQSAINGVKRDTSGCIPLTVNFTDTIHTGKIYIWNFGDGTPDTTTRTPTYSVNHTYDSLGVFHVRLISIDSMSCNIADTSYMNIRVRGDQAKISFTSQKLAPCDSLKYMFTNTSTPPAGKPFTPQSFQWSFGDGTTTITNQSPLTHIYPASGTYNVALHLIDTNYCNYPDSAILQLRIAANVKAQFETSPVGCVPYNALFTNTSLAGQQFFWDFGEGSTSTDESPTHLYTSTGTYVVKLRVVDPSTCNVTDSTQQTITVFDNPTASFTYEPTTAKENTPYVFTNNSTGAVLYKWKFGDGDSLVTAKIDATVSHIYNASGVYNVCLYATNTAGCTDSTCQQVQAIIVPLVDVPNAFTPNGDGVNDNVSVKGFGIQKMDWRIYNRWGQLIFQTGNTTQGWDGKYNGVLQPQEVYVYVLNVTFTDGKTYRKKGDITLLR